MIKILTFQDFQAATDKEAFILQAIQEYRNSDTYTTAEIAQLYYSTDNEAIERRMGYLERQMQNKVNVKFHKLRNSFFPKAIKRLALYLMGNGVTLDDTIKAKIDRKFDRIMIEATMNACVDGVVWGFPDIDNLTFFRATEFAPLYDERTSEVMAGIRFWQIDENKPMYVELYEINGITEYMTDNNGLGLTQTEPQRSYQRTIRKDAFETTVINGENYGELPVFPLYANELGISELTTGLKALIDAHDFISSDFVDTITLVEGIYWIIKNFGGQSTQELLTELQELKATLVDGADTGADSHNIEAPFQAKQSALDMLERRMYADFMIPDGSMGGRQVTATEIKAVREELEVKADLLEWQVAEFIENVLRLKGHDMLLPNFKRRTMNNDSEIVGNISTQLSGGWIDEEMAIKLDPTIPTEDKEDLIQRLAVRQLNEANNTFPFDGIDDIGGEEDGQGA